MKKKEEKIVKFNTLLQDLINDEWIMTGHSTTNRDTASKYNKLLNNILIVEKILSNTTSVAVKKLLNKKIASLMKKAKKELDKIAG